MRKSPPNAALVTRLVCRPLKRYAQVPAYCFKEMHYLRIVYVCDRQEHRVRAEAGILQRFVPGCSPNWLITGSLRQPMIVPLTWSLPLFWADRFPSRPQRESPLLIHHAAPSFMGPEELPHEGITALRCPMCFSPPIYFPTSNGTSTMLTKSCRKCMVMGVTRLPRHV